MLEVQPLLLLLLSIFHFVLKTKTQHNTTHTLSLHFYRQNSSNFVQCTFAKQLQQLQWQRFALHDGPSVVRRQLLNTEQRAHSPEQAEGTRVPSAGRNCPSDLHSHSLQYTHTLAHMSKVSCSRSSSNSRLTNARLLLQLTTSACRRSRRQTTRHWPEQAKRHWTAGRVRPLDC